MLQRFKYLNNFKLGVVDLKNLEKFGLFLRTTLILYPSNMHCHIGWYIRRLFGK